MLLWLHVDKVSGYVLQPSESKPNVTPLTVLAHVLRAIKSYAHLLYVQRLIPHQVCCRIRFALRCFCCLLLNLLGFPHFTRLFPSHPAHSPLMQLSVVSKRGASKPLQPQGETLGIPALSPGAVARQSPWSGRQELVTLAVLGVAGGFCGAIPAVTVCFTPPCSR